MAGVNDKNAFKAGLFIVGALILGIVILWVITGRGIGSGPTYAVMFDLDDDIAGLQPGAEVRVGGRPVGEVVGVDPTDDYQDVRVTIQIPDEVPLREDAVVRIQTTLTGQVWLNVFDLGSGDRLAQGGSIPGEAGTLSDLITTINRLAPEVEALVASIRRDTVPAATRLIENADGAVDDVARTAANLTELSSSLRDLVGEGTQGREDLEVTLAKARETAELLPELLDNVDEAVSTIRLTVDDTGARLRSVLDKADAAAEDVVAAAEATRETTGTVRGLIAGNRGRINQVVERLTDTARTLDLASAEIRRSPWRLLYRPSGEQRESMNLYDAARRFAEGANALQDAAVALEGATDDPAAQPQEVEALLEDLRRRFEQFDEAQRALYEELNR
jgi:ABC-type transporter Mla subunit MlaD